MMLEERIVLLSWEFGVRRKCDDLLADWPKLLTVFLLPVDRLFTISIQFYFYC